MSDKANAGDEEMLMTGIIVAVLVGIGFLLWHAFTPQITNGLRYLRLGEITISEALSTPRFGVQYPDLKEPVRLGEMKEFLQNAPVEKITTKHLAVSADLAQRQLQKPIGIILILLAVFIYLKGPHTKFKKVHTLETLMRKQAITFPYITPLLDFDPTKVPNRAPGDPVPVKLPLFAEALSPEEWMAFHRLTNAENEKAVGDAFAVQLGARFHSWQKLPNWMQILLAAFAMRAARQRDKSDDVLGRLSQCWTAKKGFSLGGQPKLLGEARAFLRSKAAEPTLKVMRQHAYVTTAMMRTLDFARSQGGVLSPGQFIWLRGHDRALWYPLNNIGRQAFHAEALGAMAHYKLEKLTQRPVPMPKIDGAIAALRGHLKSPFAKSIPQLDYGKDGKPPASKKDGRKAGIMKPAA